MSARVILLVLLAACLQSHGDKRVAVREGDCATCHLVDYDATTLPPHTMAPSATGTVTFPTTCADCHRTTSWQPALSGLHSPTFPIAAGPHIAINCLTCHDLDRAPSSVAGANTNCIQCHPPDAPEEVDIHAGLKGPMGETYTAAPAAANFCLTCHPTGLALVKHPNNRFPRTGPHASTCVSCHDRAFALPDAAANTTCLNGGCHSLAEEDGRHREEGAKYTTQRGNGSNRHFCLASGCHPDGRAE